MFVKEYGLTLDERQKWQRGKPGIMVHDLVLVANEAVPRSQCFRARVLEPRLETKGDVGSVKVKTPHSILKRLISKLCLIEATQAA